MPLVPVLVAFGFAGAAALLSESSSDILSGGEARRRRPSSFNRKQLDKGTRVEMEHVRGGLYPLSLQRRIAREIAMDHLAEDPDYYVKLARIHRD